MKKIVSTKLHNLIKDDCSGAQTHNHLVRTNNQPFSQTDQLD